jgi:hypothetical protein
MQHEREVHLIVVRDDLTTFSHLHPMRQDDGSWAVDLELPVPGRYTAFADVAPDEAPATTLRLALSAEGERESSEPPAVRTTASVDEYRVELSGEIVAAAGSDIIFRITRGQAPVRTDAYLGAAGHLVAIKSGDLDYLHVHPRESEEPGVIPFMIHAPSPGTYRLFLQFLHEGSVRTVDFTLEATAASNGSEDAESHHA